MTVQKLPRAAFILVAAVSSLSCNSEYHAVGLPGDGALPTPSDFNLGNESVEHPRGEGDAGLGATVDETEDSPSSDAAQSSGGPSATNDDNSDPAPTTPADAVVWEECGAGQCTTLQVPVDYSDASRGTLGLRLFVAKARTPALRQGVLLFNPGGPGVPVVEDASDYYSTLSRYFPTLDIVLMDNRGMGESEPINCVDPSFIDTNLAAVDAQWSLEELEQLTGVWSDFNQGCITRMGESVVANLHSANVARDMDRVRELLGEEELNLWNVSYGTVQASLYAKLFPARVRAFVLDSPVYLGDASYPDDVRDAIVAYDSELTRFLAWCATGDRCGLGTTEADVGVNYDGLRETLTEGVRYNEYRLTEAALDSTATGLLMYGEWDTFASLLRSASRGDWGPLVAITAGESSDPDADHAMLQANIVVRALDYGCPKDYSPEQAFDAIEEASSAHPRIADVYSWSFTFCLGWRTQASEARLPVSDLSSAPLLLVTSAHDAATPLTGAQNLLQQVNNASQLFVVEKEGHGVIGTDDDGTQAGISFIQSGKFDSCSGFDCLNLEQRSLSNVRSPNPLRPKRPWLRPLPIRPILRGGPRL